MIDREKVIKGLEYHLKELSVGKTCYECQYFGDNPCEIQLIANTLELLKAQEQQEPKPVDVDGKYDWYGLTAECPYCHSEWMPGYPEEVHFCPNCGKAVKWDAAD